jgi:mycothiol synthase
MQTLTMRSYKGEADLEAIAYLINTCETADKLENGTSVSELRDEFNTPFVNQARDLKLWEDSNNQLLGFGRLWITDPSEVIDGFLGFQVHPSVRGGNIETQIIQWAEQRMQEVRQEKGLPVKLRSGARDKHTERIAILENHGFVSDRYFFTMQRPLTEIIPQPQFPSGFTLRQVKPEDAEALTELFNESFIDHWNHHDSTVEYVKHEMAQQDYRAELDLIATAADGTFAAFCYSVINPEENIRRGRKEGWIEVLGTRRGFRRIGLGRAMLLSGLHRLKELGMDTASLGVDADNPNGALQLYESVGFSKLFTKIAYVKDV